MNSMPEIQHPPKKSQTLELRDRKNLSMDGVTDVRGFDENAIVAESAYGTVTVEGRGLHITVLDLDHGKLAVEGEITGIYYSEETKPKGGFFSRVWK